MSRPEPEDTSLAMEILNFYDEFVEFHDYCAFLCDAFAYMATDDQVDPYTAAGAGRFSQYMKHRAFELKQTLKRIQEKSYNNEKSGAR